MTAALLVGRDPIAWDRFVGNAADGSILQSWSWGELKARYGWQPARYFWERDGVIRGAVSVLRRRLPGGLSMSYAPHGPVLNGNLREWPAFWTELRRELTLQSGTILKVEPQWGKADAWILQETGAKASWPIQHRATAIIDLHGGEEVFARMSASARRNMRHAERAGVIVQVSADIADVDHLYALLVETAERQRFVARTRAYYRDVFRAFVPGPLGEGRVRASIYLAHHQSRVVAAGMMVRYGRRLVYLFSGSNDEGRELKAPYVLQQHAIRDSQAAGCTSYDLWGIPVDATPGTPGWGYAHFKAMLGATPVAFGGAWDLPVRRPFAAAYHLAERMVARPLAVA